MRDHCVDTQRTKAIQRKQNYWGIMGFGCGVVMLVLLVGYGVVHWIPASWKVDHAGAYEGLGALFSGLAFIGVIYALKYQREDLEQQGKTIKQQQKEMEAQRFENSFFQLLKFQRDSMQAMRVTSEHSQEWEGTRAFRKAVSNLESYFGNYYVGPMKEEQLLLYIDNNFKRFCTSDGSDFSHYFRTSYHLIEFIDKSTIEDKTYYVGLVRAQLSTDELSLLFFNGLSEEGKPFKHFIEKYALLKNWRKPETFQETYGLYPTRAYGE
jgi:hypothetical protein